MWPVLSGVFYRRRGVSRSASACGRRISRSCSRGSCSARSVRSSGAARSSGRKSTGTDLFTATIGLVGRSRRRYGGYIVHVGIVLMCLGFAGQGFKQSSQVLMKPGQQTTLGSYVVRMDALKVTNDNQKQMITGHFTVFEGGREIAQDVSRAVVLQQA
jgi:cytochrome c biogenesis factor